MLSLIWGLVFYVLVLLGVTTEPDAAQNTDYITVSSKNEALIAAREQAKSTLPVFFARAADPQPGDSDFSVQITYDTGKDSYTSVWANDVVLNGDMVTATIESDHDRAIKLAAGQRVTVPVSQLTDWVYTRDDKFQGGYTIRAMLPYMTPEEAETTREQLAPE